MTSIDTSDTEVERYVMGVAPTHGCTVPEATALLFRRGALSIHQTPELIEASFAHRVVLRGIIANDKVSACSVTTDNMVYLMGPLDIALRYVDYPAPVRNVAL